MNKPVQRLSASLVVSISELKKNPSAIIADAEGFPVAILNHNRIIGYIVPPTAYEEMMERLDDLRLLDIIKDRQDDDTVEVSVDELQAEVSPKSS